MSFLLKSVVGALAMACALAISAPTAHAGVITFNLSNITFDTGQKATGSFAIDTTTLAISNVNISTTGDANVPADSFTSGFYIQQKPPIYIPIGPWSFIESLVFPGNLPGAFYGSFLYLNISSFDWQDFRTGLPVSLVVGEQASAWPADQGNFYNPNGLLGGGEHLASGQLVPADVPEPMTLVLFGTGLLGAAAMRRRIRAKLT